METSDAAFPRAPSPTPLNYGCFPMCAAWPGGSGNTCMVLEEILSFFPCLSSAAFPNFMPSSIPKWWFSWILLSFHRFDPRSAAKHLPLTTLNSCLWHLSPQDFETAPFFLSQLSYMDKKSQVFARKAPQGGSGHCWL